MGRKRAAVAEEENFVRGGGDSLAPIEVKRLRQEAYEEAEAELFGSGAAKKGGKRQQRTAGEAEGRAGDAEDEFFSSLSLQGQLPKYAELLKFKGLSVGAKLWGAVIEVTPRELVISLPHGLRGHVAYAQASDWLHEQSKKATAAGGEAAGSSKGAKRKAGSSSDGLPPLMELFSVGQLVRCVVSALHDGSTQEQQQQQQHQGEAGRRKKDGAKAGKGSKKKRIDLSLRVKDVNAGLGPEALKEGFALPACVRSVEDHGYLLTLGIKGAPTAFLPRKSAPAGGPALQAGSLVEVLVSAAPKPGDGKAGALIVSAEREAVTGAVAREWEGLNIGSLLPGALVTARVRNVLSDGLLASFLTYFTATVDPFHLGWAGADWKKHFSPQQRLRARILYVDSSSKRVGLTLLPHLLACALPENFPLLGQVFEDATIQRVDPGLGLLCALPPPAGGVPPLAPGYAHISNVSDEQVELEKRYRPNQRVRGRVIGFRPMDGLAVLSLKPSVVEQHILSLADLRPGMPVSASVDRIEDFGLLCHVTSTIRAVVPLLHISDVPSRKALRKFKEGQKVNGRVLSVDPINKKVTLTLKPALLGSKLPPITCLQDAMPGSRSHGVVTGVQDFGVFVAFYGGITGLAHVSECGLPAGQKPSQAYEAGQAVKVRVLGVDAGRKGLRLSLVSKRKATDAETDAAAAAAAAQQAGDVPAPAGAAAGAAAADESTADALGGFQPGHVVHGVVTAVKHKEASADDQGQAPEPASYELSVFASPDAAATAGGPGPGAEGAAAAAVGRLEAAHLGDHPVAVAALKEAVSMGSLLGPLLVLQRLEGAKQLRLSRKASLLTAAQAGRLPSEFEQVVEGAGLQGYVASVTPDAVFVRFLGGLTGRAGLAQLSDTFVSDPHLHFSEGQSVRAHVAQVDAARRRFSLTLKQSLVAGGGSSSSSSSSGAAIALGTGSEYLQSLWADLALAERLAAGAAAGEEAGEVDWDRLFPIGTVVEGSVHDTKDYGLLCDLSPHPDVVGLAAPHQAAAEGSAAPAAGAPIKAVVLDVNRKDGVVDLSLLPGLVEQQASAAAAAAAAAATGGKPVRKAKKAKTGKEQQEQAAAPAQQQQESAVAVGQRVECLVQLVKESEGYCVATVSSPGSREGGDRGAAGSGRPAGLLLGFLPISDFNLRQQQLQHRFVPGDVITATVSALPSPATGGRLLLHAPLTAAGLKAAARAAPTKRMAESNGSKKGEQKQVGPQPGLLCGAKVTAVHALHADLTLDSGCRGRLHITEVADPPASSSGSGKQKGSGSRSAAGKSPLAGLKEGQQLEQVAVLGKVQTAGGRRHGLVECSTRPSVLEAAKKGPSALPKPLSWAGIKPGQTLRGYVQEVEGGFVWCAFSPTIRGRAFLPEAAPSLEACQDAAAAFKPGQAVEARVASVDASKHALDISLGGAGKAAEPEPGAKLLGQVLSVGGAGVVVQLSARSRGRCALTDIHDQPVVNALTGLEPGQYVRAAVVGAADSRGVFPLSLRPSQGGECAAHAAAEPADEAAASSAAPSSAAGLAVGQQVGGYVKSAGSAGVFVCLNRGMEARIKLSQLADGFVEQPAAAFPEGRRVDARVLHVEGDKVELTLRNSRGPAASLEGLQEGQVVRGLVRRVERFGVFVELGAPHSGATGLAHVSQLADEYVKDVGSLFSVGQAVTARVLQVDAAAGRLSLGLKPSYLADVSDADEGSGPEEGDEDFDAELAQATLSGDDEDGEEGGEAGVQTMDAKGGSDSEPDEVFDLDEELAEAEADGSGTDSSSSEDEE